MAAPDGADETAGRGDCDQASQQPVAAHRGVRLALHCPHVEQRTEGAGATGQHGVDGDGADAQVAGGGGAKGAAGIESEPSEGQNEASDKHCGDVVADDRVARSVAVELADARTDDHRHSQCRHSTDRMDNARSGKVAIALSEPHVGAQLREPAAAPGPVAIQRIGKCAHQHRGNRKREKLPPFRGSAGHDGQGRIHEHHLEQEDDHDADVIGVPGEEHAALAEDAPMWCRTA